MKDSKTEIDNMLDEIANTYEPHNFMFLILADYTEVSTQALKAGNRGDSETEAIIDEYNKCIFKLAEAYAELFYSAGRLAYKKEGLTPPYTPTREELDMLSEHPIS